MNRMFFNSQCPIFPDEYAIGKIVEPDRKNRTLPRWYVCRIFRVMPFSLRSQIADILNILEFMKKNYLMAVCLFLTVMSGCGNKEQAPQQAEPVKVKVMTVVSSVRNEAVRFSGTVQEENGSSLSFPLMGRVKSVKVDLGSRVRQGQLLATLDEVSMQNTYQAAKAALKQAEDVYQRMKELHEKGSLAEMKWVEVQSKLQQAQSMEAVARKNLTDCQLYAPFSGVIAEKSLEVGQNVVPGVQVMKLVSDDRLKVRISVPETEIARVARGQKAVIEAPVLNGTKAEGVVTEKGVQANPLSRSYEVNVGIQTKNTGLLPGMVTEVWLQDADKSQACVLPANVLQLDEHNNYFVWLKGEDGKASKRVVACGKFTATGVTVVNGLNEGDEVIVEGQQKVCEGTPLAL